MRRDEFRRLRRNAKGIDAPLEYMIDEAMIDRHGILRVAGWVVSFPPLQEIAVSFSGHKLGLAEYGLLRNDVGAVYANYPESDRSGFSFIQELDADLTDPLVAVEITALGSIKRQQAVVPAVAAAIERHKQRDAKIRYHVDMITLTDDGMLIAEGWAFSGLGIEVIAIELDDEAVGEAVVGLSRPDVGNAYPSIASARWGGFRISKNLGRRFEGEHMIVLTVRDAIERRVIPLPIAATIQQQDDKAVTIEFHIDNPPNFDGKAIDPIYGDLSVLGWAVAPTGIDRVEVFLNDAYKGNAYYGARRDDIKAARPTMLDSGRSGFGMSIPGLPTWRKRDAGTQSLRVVVYDRDGNSAQRDITIEVNNSTDAGPWRLRRRMKQAEIDIQNAVLDAMCWHPTFLILLRLRDTNWKEIERATYTIDKVREQVYQEWRMLVVVPLDGKPSAIHDLASDHRITIIGATDAPFGMC